MNNKIKLTEEEYKIIYAAVYELDKYGKTNIRCPICNGKINCITINSSYEILCENCGTLETGRGI